MRTIALTIWFTCLPLLASEVDELSLFLEPGLPEPTSRIHVEGTFGTDAYYSTAIDGQVGISPTLSVVGGGLYVQSSPGFTSGLGYLGVDYYESGVWGLRLSGLGQAGPGEVSAFGGSADASVHLNGLWSGRLATILDVSLSGQQYRFSLAGPGPNGRPQPTSELVQTRLLLGVTQELSTRFSLGASVSAYRYSVPVEALNRATSDSRLQFPAVVGTIQGFPLNVLAARARWAFHESWAAEASLSATRTAVSSSRAVAAALLIQYSISRDLIVGARGTYLKSSTGDKDGLGTLELDYHW